MNTIVLEHFKSILFHKSRSAKKQHTNQSIKNIKQEWNGGGAYDLTDQWYQYLDKNPKNLDSMYNLLQNLG